MFDHEKLDVYRVSIEFVKWTHCNCANLTGKSRRARDQIIRASQSVPQNIAEGNGKRSVADRKRFFEISRGSAFECAAILDIFLVTDAISEEKTKEGKRLLHRIVSMLTKMIMSVNVVREDDAIYGDEMVDVLTSENENE